MNQEAILTVSQLTHQIKNMLETRFALVQLEGEITNLKRQASGHIYFSLKDASAQISAVLFRGNASSLTFQPKDGDKVLVKGELSVYPPRGGYQIIIRSMRPAGVGALLMQLHERKKKLQLKGYFDKSQKLPIPTYPKRIGVITSPTGAVIQDILNVLSRRHSAFSLVLYPVNVQGAGAAEEIALAIREANRHQIADVLIVGRGGGSLEDLWAFNEECVADALYESTVPTIAAVGHETDFTIADFVADMRAPTPSAAAEIVMREMQSQLTYLTNAKTTLHRIIRNTLSQLNTHLDRFRKHPLLLSPYGLLKVHMQRLDDLSDRLQSSMKGSVTRSDLTLTRFTKQLSAHNPLLKIEAFRKRLTALSSHINAINPENLLQKGYCISFDENTGSVIIGTEQIEEGMEITLRYHDGEAKVTATKAQV